MDKSRAYIRFVLPGVVMLGEWLLASLVVGSWDIGTLGDGKQSFGNFFGILVAAGGAGYLVSNVYFTVCPHIDYLPSIRALIENDVLRVYRNNVEKVLLTRDVESLSSEEMLVIANQLWFLCVGNDKTLELAEKYALRNNDLANSVGITGVGTIFMMFVWNLSHCGSGLDNLWIVNVAGVCIIFCLTYSWSRLRTIVCKFNNNIRISYLTNKCLCLDKLSHIKVYI